MMLLSTSKRIGGYLLLLLLQGGRPAEANDINFKVNSLDDAFLELHSVQSTRFLQGAMSVGGEDCSIVEECSLCDSISKKEISECSTTGRIERWKCDPHGGDADGNPSAGTLFLNQSCLRTKADDEFLMVRLQVLCVLIGTAAFVSARKQKVLSASLFDQRKLGVANNKRRKDSMLIKGSEIELTAASSRDDEMIPLTQDAVDVV